MGRTRPWPGPCFKGVIGAATAWTRRHRTIQEEIMGREDDDIRNIRENPGRHEPGGRLRSSGIR